MLSPPHSWRAKCASAVWGCCSLLQEVTMRAPYGRRVALLLIVSASAACTRPSAPTTRPERESGRVITREQITRSGAVDAWQALRHYGTFLEIKEDRRGNGGHVYQRGRGSFLLSSELMLVVD